MAKKRPAVDGPGLLNPAVVWAGIKDAFSRRNADMSNELAKLKAEYDDMKNNDIFKELPSTRLFDQMLLLHDQMHKNDFEVIHKANEIFGAFYGTDDGFKGFEENE